MRALFSKTQIPGVLFYLYFSFFVIQTQPSNAETLSFRVDQFTVEHAIVTDGQLVYEDATEYYLTNMDHSMTLEEEVRYMEGELHQLFHNQTDGWVYLVRPAGKGKRKRFPSKDVSIPLLKDLQKRLTILLPEFPHRFVIVFYCLELGTLRIRFHPQENENAAFYHQMMHLLNSQFR